MTEKLLRIAPGDILYLLGDYIDRGPASKEVIDHISELKNGGVNVHALKGNHEDMFMKALDQPEASLDHWLMNGGKSTLQSFGLADAGYSSLSRDSFDKKYIDFINNLGYYIEAADFYFVHAGFNFSAPDPLKDYHSMLWIRNAVADENFLGNKKVIHGHTPRTLQRIQDSLHEKMINIDGGCVYKGTSTGHLVALDPDSMQLHYTLCLD